MTRFADMKLEQQKALFMRAARDVLRHWRLEGSELRWLAYSANAVFDARGTSGRYILRLSVPGSLDEDMLRSELMWLRAIRQETRLLAPLPLPTTEGAFYATMSPSALADDSEIQAALFERINGAVKAAKDLTCEDMRAIGAYLGNLHSQAQFSFPADFKRHRLDYAGLFAVGSAYHVPRERDLLASQQREIFAAVGERVRSAMAQLDDEDAGFGLIHADLLAKNILFTDDSIAALDFEHCGWGYFLYDLTPLLWQLKGERAQDYPALKAALWQAYAAARGRAGLQHDKLETLIAARQLLSCRWLLLNSRHASVRAVAPALLDARCQELEAFLVTGILHRSSATL